MHNDSPMKDCQDIEHPGSEVKLNHGGTNVAFSVATGYWSGMWIWSIFDWKSDGKDSLNWRVAKESQEAKLDSRRKEMEWYFFSNLQVCWQMGMWQRLRRQVRVQYFEGTALQVQEFNIIIQISTRQGYKCENLIQYREFQVDSATGQKLSNLFYNFWKFPNFDQIFNYSNYIM